MKVNFDLDLESPVLVSCKESRTLLTCHENNCVNCHEKKWCCVIDKYAKTDAETPTL